MVDIKNKMMSVDKIKELNIPVGTLIEITYRNGEVSYVNYQGIKEGDSEHIPELIYNNKRSPKPKSTLIEAIIGIRGLEYKQLGKITGKSPDDGLVDNIKDEGGAC